MGVEIERKFRVLSQAWRDRAGPAEAMRQGYLSLVPERTVRVRVTGDRGFLTVKGRTVGATRAEYEYPIAVADALGMLELCLQPIVHKTRSRVPAGIGLWWEIDVFLGDNAGLVVAEIELASPDQAFERPPWLGQEVTHDPRYFNANLVHQPYCTWDSPH